LTHSHIAIAYPSNLKRVVALCQVTKRLPEGEIVFIVENGAWQGRIKNDLVEVLDFPDEAPLPGVIVWEGNPEIFKGLPRTRDYNDVIRRIEQEIAK
jgi:hypothetical protein